MNKLTRRRHYRITLVSAIILNTALLNAAVNDKAESNPASNPPAASAATALRERLRHLEEELRCLVCQNQSLADSNADLALDLRREIADLAQHGKSDAEIVTFLQERYGDFVTYRPPFKTSTALLWLGPLLFFGLAAGGVIVYARRRGAPSAPEEASISPAAEARARALLGLDQNEN